GLEQRTAGGEASEDVPLPGYCEAAIVVGDELERVVGRFEQRARTAVEFLAEAAFGGREEQSFVGEACRWIDPELEPGEVTDRFGTDADLAVGCDSHRQGVGAARADIAHQHRSPAVDEALG